MEEKNDESLLTLLARCRPSGRETLESNWTGDSGNNTMFLKPKYSLWCPRPHPHSSAPTHVEAQREPLMLQHSLRLVLKSSRFSLCKKYISSFSGIVVIELYKTIYIYIYQFHLLKPLSLTQHQAPTWRHGIGGSGWISGVVALKLQLWEKLDRGIFLEGNAAGNRLCLLFVARPPLLSLLEGPSVTSTSVHWVEFFLSVKLQMG